MVMTLNRSGVRQLGLGLIRNSIVRLSVPGRYMLADRAGRLLAPESGLISSHIGNYTVELDLRDEIQRQVYFDLYEQSVTRLLRNLLSDGSTFFDVGANIGYFTLLASDLVGCSGSVHAFEPVPANAERIRQNLVDNGVSNAIINQVAVSDGAGTVTLFLSEHFSNTGWASVVPSERRRQKLEVPALSLDHYLLNTDTAIPDLIKIDIEGAEPKALEGMRQLLAGEESPNLIIEINPLLLHRAGSSPQDVLRSLIEAGYSVYQIADQGMVRIFVDSEIKGLIDIFGTKRSEPWW